MYTETDQLRKLLDSAGDVLILQADNPDSDSLGSALALESILGDMGKQTTLYCAVDMPSYLRYLPGWDRVQAEVPKQFDLSIVVDASTMTLFEKLSNSGQQGWVAAKPCIVLDHHEIVENLIPFATVTINDHKRASTGELIFILAKDLGWPLSVTAQEFIASSILGDTQGLSNQLASSQTYRIMADMVEAGVDRPRLEELRREYGKMQPEIFKYKAELIRRSEFTYDGKIACVTVSQDEISKYSPLYNPAPLIQNDLLQTVGVAVAIVFKQYTDGKVTGAIRCNPGAPIAAKLAETLGGGGHAFASGFKVVSGKPFNEIKAECLGTASELLATLEQG
jgi:phosphoesterase RecJ-like protein